AAESVAGAPTGRRHGDGRRRGPGQGHWHVRTRPSDPLRGRRRQLLLPAAGPEVPRRALFGSARARGSPRDVPSGPAPAAALHHGRLLLPGRDRVDVPRGSRITAAAPGRPPRARKRLAGTGARTLHADAVRAGRVLHDAVHLLPRRRRLGDLPPCRLGPRPPPRGGRGAQASAPLQPRLLSGELHEPVRGARAPLPRARPRALRRLGVRLRVARLPLLLPPHPPARGRPRGKAVSSRTMSSSVSSSVPAAALSSTWGGRDAFGMVKSPGNRTRKASATARGVAPCARAIAASNRPPALPAAGKRPEPKGL